MPLSNFDPGGARGFPIIGAGLGYGWKKDSNIYFVDKGQGSDDNPGDDPDSPFATIEKAVATITPWDVVYIMEGGFDTTGSDPTTYIGASANHTIALADTGVAFVGVSHAGMLGYPMTPYIMGLAATETPIFTVNAPLTAWENLHLSGNWANANTSTAGIYAPDNVTGTAMAQGISIYNCSFEDLEGAAPTQATTYPGGGVSIIGTWYSVVNHCRFRNCVVGVQTGSSSITMVATVIENNVFFADATTDVNADISCYMQGTSDICIKGNYFAHNLPTYASGSALRFISCVGSEVGMISDNHCAHSATRTAGPNGTGILAPAAVGCTANYCLCALMGNA